MGRIDKTIRVVNQQRNIWQKAVAASRNPRLAKEVVSRRVSQKLSQIAFRNNAGIRGNITGLLSIRKNALLSFDVEADRDRGRELWRQGYLSLGRPFYDHDVMRPIREEYEEHINDAPVRAEYESVVYSRMLVKAYEKIPELRHLMTPDLEQVIRGYFGSHFRVSHLTCWRNKHVPQDVLNETEIFSNRWHADRAPVSWLKIFINLSDVSSDDGPFHVLSRQRTAELIRGGFVNRMNYGLPMDVVEDSDHVVRATGPSGSLMFCNTSHCLHRAGIPDPGHHRDIIQLTLVPSTEPLGDDWLGQVEPRPFEQKAER